MKTFFDQTNTIKTYLCLFRDSRQITNSCQHSILDVDKTNFIVMEDNIYANISLIGITILVTVSALFAIGLYVYTGRPKEKRSVYIETLLETSFSVPLIFVAYRFVHSWLIAGGIAFILWLALIKGIVIIRSKQFFP